jgi:hypothetical protein
MYPASAQGAPIGRTVARLSSSASGLIDGSWQRPRSHT